MAETEINEKKLIVIGGSSGSLKVVLQILGNVPGNYPIPILLILHRGNSSDSALLDLLILKSRITAREVEEKEKIVPYCVYTAPADYHVLIEKDETFALDY